MTTDPHRPTHLPKISIVGTILVLAALATAQQPEKKEEGPSSWLPILREQAADYEIVPKVGMTTRPKPLADPILRWTQPVRGGDDGAVFLWVADGRPVAVGTIFTYRVPGSKRVLQHEVHSLMESDFEATWRGRVIWHPKAPGLTFADVPDAPVPGDSATGRMRQMQAIARDFAAESEHEKAGRNELRLMPRPLHRYGPVANVTVDGAMFCFAQGTDPEAFLMIEARRKGDTTRWQYAFARFSDLALRASYKGRDVWKVKYGEWDRRDGIHGYYVVEQVDADTPEQYRKLAEAK